jgi:nitroimidazol reductase NimA-like FMN-containing flavoprotein (pyridoxamine 5'-phosphate oxidase superfamily)
MIGKLNTGQIEDVLENNILGRLGCYDGQRMYIVPINYVYRHKHIIAHSTEGLKIRMMRKNPQVCFEVDEMNSFTNWKSVIAWGEFQELTSERQRYDAMKLFVDRMMHLKISDTAVLPELASGRVHQTTPGITKSVVYRIVLGEKTGRYESSHH